ncbi:proton-coupled amino acid transporter 2-like isoform X2 [Harmonia axyridis]|uniref:proton-coupled amino acid transporter 2-like isoform X2 n=1 Tax=Harmonia axyridis TaxID=115357 RepID=UPI001E279850|nr:proton-coupled amino acid transporter 2-like isoform X2 [Harmonia axyridis]
MAEPPKGEIDERTGLKKKPPSGYCLSIMNHLKCCVGSGIFALGFAFKNAGMILGPPILVVLGLVALHCQHMLLQCGQEVEKHIGRRPDLAETGEGVFKYGPEKVRNMQKCMKVFSNVLLIVTQTGVLCIYTVFFADSMMRVAEHWGYTDLSIQMWVLIAFPPIVISSSLLGNLMLVGFLSLFANILVLLGIIITIYLTSTNLPEEYTFEWIGNMLQLPMFISIGILSFTAIQVVLPIYIEIDDPAKVSSFFGVLNMALLIEMVLTILIGVLSYLKYGKDCRGSVTLNFENGIAAQIVVICVGISVMLSYTLNIYVVIEALFPIMAEKWGPFRFPRLGIFLFRLGCIIFTFILSWTLPMLGQIVALAGALGNTSLSIIFPAFFHVVLMWEKSSVCIKIKDFLILFLGIFSLIAGLVAAILDIIKEIDKVYNPQQSTTIPSTATT